MLEQMDNEPQQVYVVRKTYSPIVYMTVGFVGGVTFTTTLVIIVLLIAQW